MFLLGVLYTTWEDSWWIRHLGEIYTKDTCHKYLTQHKIWTYVWTTFDNSTSSTTSYITQVLNQGKVKKEEKVTQFQAEKLKDEFSSIEELHKKLEMSCHWTFWKAVREKTFFQDFPCRWTPDFVCWTSGALSKFLYMIQRGKY